MSDTRVLLSKIAALRQRLEKTADTAGPLKAETAAHPERVRQVESRLAAAARYGALLDGSFRQLAAAPTAVGEPAALPSRLTARVHRLLKHGSSLLGQLRLLGEHFAATNDVDPLAERYAETVAIADTALRCVQAYPDAAAAQLRLCVGLEATLQVVAERIEVLHGAVARRRRDADRIATLADLLHSLETGKPTELKSFLNIAEMLLAETQESAPLRFHLAEMPVNRGTTQLIARHSLTVAQVAARLATHDADLRGQAIEAVLAALVHDVGMLRVPVEVLSHAGPLEDARRAVEAHPRVGAELLAKAFPDAGWLAEVTAAHQERVDGTGYPLGLRDSQIPALARLLAVCDVYTALSSARAHRAALDPRTALTDTLLLADKGSLDRTYAERLLCLSFYPVGAVVELTDGAIGVVVATHPGRDLSTTARPVVNLLINAQGQPLPAPRPLDLAESEGRSIVRALPPAERRRILGKRYAEVA